MWLLRGSNPVYLGPESITKAITLHVQYSLIAHMRYSFRNRLHANQTTKSKSQLMKSLDNLIKARY